MTSHLHFYWEEGGHINSQHTKLLCTLSFHMDHHLFVNCLLNLCRLSVHWSLARGMEQPECVWEPEGDPRSDALQVRKPLLISSLSVDLVLIFPSKPATWSFYIHISFSFLPVARLLMSASFRVSWDSLSVTGAVKANDLAAPTTRTAINGLLTHFYVRSWWNWNVFCMTADEIANIWVFAVWLAATLTVINCFILFWRGVFSLAVQNLHIHSLGLRSLRSVSGGLVLLHNNSQLCYSSSLSWENLLHPPQGPQRIVSRNKDPRVCGRRTRGGAKRSDQSWLHFARTLVSWFISVATCGAVQ